MASLVDEKTPHVCWLCAVRVLVRIIRRAVERGKVSHYHSCRYASDHYSLVAQATVTVAMAWNVRSRKCSVGTATVYNQRLGRSIPEPELIFDINSDSRSGPPETRLRRRSVPALQTRSRARSDGPDPRSLRTSMLASAGLVAGTKSRRTRATSRCRDPSLAPAKRLVRGGPGEPGPHFRGPRFFFFPRRTRHSGFSHLYS